jgi:hypothetical protein
VTDEYAVRAFLFDSDGASVDAQVPSVDYRANRTAAAATSP